MKLLYNKWSCCVHSTWNAAGVREYVISLHCVLYYSTIWNAWWCTKQPLLWLLKFFYWI